MRTGGRDDTIFALASGGGRAAIAVVRVSGPGCRDLVTALAGRLPAPRRASLATLRDPASGTPLDHALALWFPAPHSFTGEDAAEFHLHGGRAVVAAVLGALGRFPGCRLAEPGEFTRRAFRNGRMDLAGVESLADLIDAETEAQRRQALRLLEGGLARWVATLREGLLDALALAEGSIDFAEEDDLAGSFAPEIERLVRAVDATILEQLSLAGRGERLREGLVVAITGPPNAGKSTLLNALAGREAAIVSAHAGTTRDPIEVGLDLRGYPLVLIDTAGMRETDDPVEREGIARARARAGSADLVLWLREARDAALPPPVTAGALWCVETKADLPGATADAARVRVSARTGAGLPDLIAALTDFAATALVGAETAFVTRARHSVALEAARASLRPILAGARPLELVAEDLRAAARHLDAIVGPLASEDVLGAIFGRFCIGK